MCFFFAKLHLFSHSWTHPWAPYKHSFWSADIYIHFFLNCQRDSNKSFQLKPKTPLDLFYYSFKFLCFNFNSKLLFSLSAVLFAWGTNWLPVSFSIFNFIQVSFPLFYMLPELALYYEYGCAQTWYSKGNFVFFLSTRKLYYQSTMLDTRIGCSLHEPHIYVIKVGCNSSFSFLFRCFVC